MSLDEAIKAYRENPTEANRQLVLALQQQHVATFHNTQAADFIRRTKRAQS